MTIKPLGTQLSKFEVSGVLDPGLNKVSFTATPSEGFILGPGATLKVKAPTYADNFGLWPTTYYVNSVFDYTANGNQTIANTGDYGILQISGSGTKTLAGNTQVYAPHAGTELRVLSAVLDLGPYTLNRAGTGAVAGGTLTLSGGAMIRIGGTGTFPAGYATRNIASTSTVGYYGANQLVANELYGNLTLSGTNIKTMPASTMTIAGKLLSAGSTSFEARGALNVNGDVEISESAVFNGGATGNFTHTIGGNWVNNASFLGGNSTVLMNAAGKTISRTAAGAAAFNNLSISGAGISITAPSVLLAGNLITSGSGTLSQVNGGTLTMSGTSKTISGTGITLQNITIDGVIGTSATFEVRENLTVNTGKSFTATAGTLNMTGAGKTISSLGSLAFFGLRVNGTIGTATSFKVNSDLSGAGKLTATAGVANFSGTSTFNGSHDLFDVAVTGVSLRMAANARMGVAGALTVAGGSAFDAGTNAPNTVAFNGTGTQAAPGLTYHNISFINSGAKSAGGAIVVNGNLLIDAGSNFSAGTHAHIIKGDWVNRGVFTHNNGTITLAGGADTFVKGVTTFNTLTINKTAASNTATQDADITANLLNLVNGVLITGPNKVNVLHNRTGSGWVRGTIRRVHPFNANTAYAFNGPYTQLLFGTASGITEISVTVNPTAVANFPAGAAINGTYTVAIPAGSYSGAMLQLQYTDAELNGNPEDQLKLYRRVNSTWVSEGKDDNDVTLNWVSQVALTDVTGVWTLSATSSIYSWTGATSTSWELASNWQDITNGTPVSAGSAPTATDIAELGDAAVVDQPLINSEVEVKGLRFKGATAITLTLGTGSSLAVRGNLTAAGPAAVAEAPVLHTVNVASGTLGVGGDMILNDGSVGNSLSINIDAGTVTVAGDLDHSGNSVIRLGSGNFKLKGSFLNADLLAFAKETGTFTYEGGGSQIIGIVYYNNLVINKSAGVATLLTATEGRVGGVLTVNSGILSIPGGDYILEKDLVQNGGLIEVGSSTIAVQGNWTKNGGVFEPRSSTITLKGSMLNASSALAFNNLIISLGDIASTLSVTGNIIVNSDLTLQSGLVNLGTSTINRSAAGGKLVVGSTAALALSGSNFPSNYNNVLLDQASTVKYDGAIAQNIAAVKYGNLQVVNGGTVAKRLTGATSVAGTLSIGSDASLNANEQTVTLSGDMVNNGSFSPGAYTAPLTPKGTLVLASTDGAVKTIGGASAIILNNLVVQPGAVYKINNHLTLNGDADIVGNGDVDDTNYLDNGHMDLGLYNISVAGDLKNQGILKGSGNWTLVGNRVQNVQFLAPILPSTQMPPTVIFDGSVSPVLNSTAPPAFGNLIINNTAGVTASVDWAVAGLFHVKPGATFNGEA
ncbi:hypothetical protein GCM10028895_35790 [Pontibacter rugosus]